MIGEAMTLSPYRETFCSIKVQVSSVALYLDFFFWVSTLSGIFFSFAYLPVLGLRSIPNYINSKQLGSST